MFNKNRYFPMCCHVCFSESPSHNETAAGMKERKERLPRLDILSAIKRGCPKRSCGDISRRTAASATVCGTDTDSWRGFPLILT